MSLLLLGGTKVVAASAYVAPDWEILRDFEGGTVGASATTASGFSEAMSLTTISDEQAASGTKSAKCSVVGGVTNSNTMGGRIVPTTPLVKGDIFWVQFQAYFPPGFDPTAASGSLKFLRLLRRPTGGGSNKGAFEFQISNPSESHSYRAWSEGQPETISPYIDNVTPDGQFTTGQWVPYTARVVVDNELVADGGTARATFWQGVSRIWDTVRFPTINEATHEIYDVYWFTYWNGVTPATQSCYLDDIHMAKNGRPAWVLDLEEIP